MKRIIHYLLLASVLLGVPLACCLISGDEDMLAGVKSFPPRTEDWGFHPEMLWNHRCPFNWWTFAGMVAFVYFVMKPFVVRCFKAWLASRNMPRRRPSAPFPWWGWVGVVILATGWVLSWSRFAWFRPYQVLLSYAPLWLGFILIMNALCVRRSGHSPMTDHPWAYAATFPARALFWWFFEYLNRYVWNWYYVGVSDLSAVMYAVYATVCFMSVLPAVAAVAAWLHTFPAFADHVYSGMARVNLRRRGWCAFLAGISFIGLTGIVFFPAYTYPLLWISPVAVFILVQAILRERSVTDDFVSGNWSVFFRFATASLICGICWETWNYYALAKWVYAVPYVHRFQIWEMPFIGFAGYLPFGLECAATTAWILPELIGQRKAEEPA